MIDDKDETNQSALTFRDARKKEEAKVREQEKESLEKMSDMKGFISPMPDSIKLKHDKPAFTEAIDAMIQAVAKHLNPLKLKHKEDTKKKHL